MNNFKPKRVILIGSGYSMKSAIEDGLWDIIKNEFTIGINYLFKWFEPTATFFGDYKFYKSEKENLDKLKVIIGMDRPQLTHYKSQKSHIVSPNVYLLNRSTTYHSVNSLSKGCFSSCLSGVFLLTVCIALKFEEIYLLGYDFGDVIKDEYTHFYQDEFEHKGVGCSIIKKGNTTKKNYKTNNYNKNPNEYFKVFEPELKRIQIVNVCPESKIDTFPKISYNQFFEKIEKEQAIVLQSRAQEWLEQALENYKTNK